LTNTYVLTLGVSGTNLFAGTEGGGIFRSTNNGTSWTAVNEGFTYPNVSCFAVSETNLFAGAFDRGVFRSTNDGTSWTEVNTGLMENVVYTLVVSGTNLFAGTYANGVWKRPLSEIITSVEFLSANVPAHFSLEQNFPNPFNPVTTITFSLPSKSFVTLKIFDPLGKEVSVLLADELTPGTYSRQWDAGTFSSGVYFYSLRAGSFSETRKLILLR